jgi:predicted AAA+ superfamily ATPase
MRVGGFPEPFLEDDETFYRRWRRSHLDIILRQDLIDLESVRDVQAIETLIELLRVRVGSPVSFASLARDLERDASTIKRWLALLENLYVVFRVSPFHRNIARALLKEPKYYFFDVGQVEGTEGVRLENAVALSLLKEIHALEDSYGVRSALHYLRTRERREIDFLVMVDQRPIWMIEVKWSDSEPSPSFRHFRRFVRPVDAIQLVGGPAREADFPDGPRIRDAARWLAALDLAAATHGGGSSKRPNRRAAMKA